jgi:hypothetical protein
MPCFGKTLMKKFVSLGTECVEFLKAARASHGKLFCHPASFICLTLRLCGSLSSFLSSSCATDTLSAANARISSLEAELKASRKTWDVAAAAKTAAEKSTKLALAKAKKVEKALADANQERF